MNSGSREPVVARDTQQGLREVDDRYRALVELAPDAVVVHQDRRIALPTATGVHDLALAEEALRASEARCQAQVRERTEELTAAVGALEAERRRFRDVLDKLPAYVVLLSPDRRVVLANRCFEELFGVVGSRRCHEHLFGRAVPCARCETFRVREPGEPHNCQWRGPDGRDYDVHAFPFADADGSPLVLEMGIDVSEKMRAEAELRELAGRLEHLVAERTDELRAANARLEEADRRKDEFLAMLSHELRNPLAPITNSLFVLERAPAGSEATRRAREVLDRQVAHLSRLVDDLLDVTRIARNKIQLRRERADLREIVRRGVEDQRATFERAGIDLEVELPAEPIPAHVDPTRLAQVVGNLLQNAAKFTRRGGRARVAVAADHARARAVLRVADTGVGMSPETLAGLFQPFVQAEQTLHRSAGGLGLGLALVKGLVELHGGEVGARSEGMGKGAELVVTLPIEPVAAAGPVGPEDGRVERPRPARRVLVVEDNADAAASLRDVLDLAGHEVAVAATGPEGLARARAWRPEVVLCDIGLPGMDGFELARALRADPQARGAYLVALSGYALPDDLQRAAEAGFDEHLAKPPSPERLERALARRGPAGAAAPRAG